MTWNESCGPFYKANLHTHTTASDGFCSPGKAAIIYREAGYDILSITDHRKVTELPEAPKGLLLMHGIEYDYTLPGEAIHLVGIGVDKSINGLWSQKMSPQQTIDLVHAHGGAVVLAHPGWSLNNASTIAELRGLTAVEIWNSVSNPPYNPARADASLLLDVLWSNYPQTLIPVVASDDTHFYDKEVARGWTMILAETLTVPAVVKALHEGRFYASCGPEIKAFELVDGCVRVACSPCAQVIFYSNTPWASHRCLEGNGITGAEIMITDYDRYIRVQVVDQQGRSAWTMPVPVRETWT